MVRLRLRRTGLRHQPSYRIMAADKECPRDGRFLEILGSYNPRTEPFSCRLNEGKIYEWLKNGAQPTESVAKIFKSVGLTARYERLKGGESLETLLQEAEKEYSQREANQKTRQ